MPPVVVPPRDNNNAGPPQPNPVLTAYESYCRDTPLVTRYVLNVTVLSFLAGFLFSPAYLLANIPIFTIFKFQLYRIITSPLICTDILSLFFTFMGFMNHGVKLEQSMGSTFFAVLFFTLTIVTNILFLIISILLWGLTNNEGYLASASMGIWTVLLGIIAVECASAPPDTKRKLFFFDVPTIYYPLVLLALFSMFAGVKLAYCLGVAVGYAYGYGKLDRFKVRPETVRKWENREGGGCLSGFVQRAGFIGLESSSGPNAWLISSGGNDNNGGGGPGAVRTPDDPAVPSAPSFPSSGGRSLGGSSSGGGVFSRGSKAAPKTHEERAALLERAAERRRQQEADSGV